MCRVLNLPPVRLLPFLDMLAIYGVMDINGNWPKGKNFELRNVNTPGLTLKRGGGLPFTSNIWGGLLGF